MPLDIAARLPGAGLRQPGPPGLEHRQLAARRLEPLAPVPPGLGSLPQVGMRLAPRPRLHGHAVLIAPHDARAGSGCLRRLVTVQPVAAVKPAIEPAHSKSMR